MQLTCCSIPRSGSTLVWQILKTIFHETEIPKIHPDTPIADDSTCVSTIRHPYDVAASRYRVRLSRGGVRDGGPLGLEAEIGVMITMFANLSFILKVNSCDIHLLRYEDFYQDHTPIYELAHKLGRPVPEKDRIRISAMFSADANRKRAAKLKSFYDVGEENIHGDHLGPVEPGSWRSSPEWMRKMIQDSCYLLCVEWGYAI